jgi:uncharacterized protein (DUF305 family)
MVMRRLAMLVTLLVGLALPAAWVASPAAAGTTSTDQAFVRLMIPHHQMAVQMGQMVPMLASHAKLRHLAKTIVTTQRREIASMRRVARRFGVRPDQMPMNGKMSTGMMHDLQTLHLSAMQSGMTMNMSRLKDARPFDRMFIDMMVPHHQGAIRMARAELARGTSTRLRTLASTIIHSQSRQIRMMNRWRKAWYGASSSAGGAPVWSRRDIGA